jgi:hypothetical protein
VWAACCLSVADAQLARAQPPQFGPNAAAGASISANNWPAMQAVSGLGDNPFVCATLDSFTNRCFDISLHNLIPPTRSGVGVSAWV